MAEPAKLTRAQANVFDRFLLEGTANTLRALETVFELNIDGSESTIEVAPTLQNENLRHFSGEPLYIISSTLDGEVDGSIALFMRASDFKYLSEVMRPLLSLCFYANSDADLTALDHQKPDWMQKDDEDCVNDECYKKQMMDVFAEMGNVLLGQYTRSISNIYGLNAQHSVPLLTEDPQQLMTRKLLFSSGDKARFRIVIENEMILDDKPVMLWCLISPTADSFTQFLHGVHV
jgi:chemotaxis protein CheY-P-specific phosphatase CheC